MKSKLTLIATILLLCYSFSHAQIYTPSGLITGASGNTNVGIGITSPTAKLDIGEANFKGNALRLRAGDSYGYTLGANQILFSYYGTGNYTHAIRSRHHSGRDADNALDFFVWDYGTDAAGATGSKLVMSLNGGKVGIGTGSPEYLLTVENKNNSEDDASNRTFAIKAYCNDCGTSWYPLYVDGYNQNVGIGVAGGYSSITDDWIKYNSKLHVRGQITSFEKVGSSYSYVTIYAHGGGGAAIFTSSNIKYLDFFKGPGVGNYQNIRANKAYFTEVQVSTVANFPDYVFDRSYNLKNLNEVETFIRQNNHLPGIPSEAEVKENGLNLGDMDALLLQKIEELTLYVIELNKDLQKKQSEINALKKSISGN